MYLSAKKPSISIQGVLNSVCCHRSKKKDRIAFNLSGSVELKYVRNITYEMRKTQTKIFGTIKNQFYKNKQLQIILSQVTEPKEFF